MVDFKITDIEQLDNGQFKVHLETAYCEIRITFAESDKFLNVETKKPRFLHKIKEHLEKKYADMEKVDSTVSTEFDIYLNKTYDSKKLEDLSVKALAKRAKDKVTELKIIE